MLYKRPKVNFFSICNNKKRSSLHLYNHPKFVFWNFLSGFLGGVNYSLTTHNMLLAININNPLTTATGSFIGKDIIGQVGSIFFSHSKRIQFAESNPIKFGTYMCILTNICFGFENMTLLYPEYFLLFAGGSNLLKNVSFIGQGSINAKLVQKISETSVVQSYSILSSHNSLSSATGLAAGIYLTHIFPDESTRVYILTPAVSLLHMYSYRKSISCIF